MEKVEDELCDCERIMQVIFKRSQKLCHPIVIPISLLGHPIPVGTAFPRDQFQNDGISELHFLSFLIRLPTTISIPLFIFFSPGSSFFLPFFYSSVTHSLPDCPRLEQRKEMLNVSLCPSSTTDTEWRQPRPPLGNLHLSGFELLTRSIVSSWWPPPDALLKFITLECDYGTQFRELFGISRKWLSALSIFVLQLGSEVRWWQGELTLRN